MSAGSLQLYTFPQQYAEQGLEKRRDRADNNTDSGDRRHRWFVRDNRLSLHTVSMLVAAENILWLFGFTAVQWYTKNMDKAADNGEMYYVRLIAPRRRCRKLLPKPSYFPTGFRPEGYVWVADCAVVKNCVSF